MMGASMRKVRSSGAGGGRRPGRRGIGMKEKMVWASAATVVVLFSVLLWLCIYAWGSDPADSSKLMLSSSFLASTLSLFVLICAVLMRRKAESPSERYQAKYGHEDEGDGPEKK